MRENRLLLEIVSKGLSGKRLRLIRRRWLVVVNPLVVGVVLALLGGGLYLYFFSVAEQHSKPAASIDFSMKFLTAVFLGVGLIQWKQAREERSLEHFYDRLERLNTFSGDKDMYLKEILGVTLEAEGELAEQEWEEIFFVFREIDNLECSLQKFRMGWMSREHVERALRLFYGRCRSPEFRWRAEGFTDETSTHTDMTREVVRILCEVAIKNGERSGPPRSFNRSRIGRAHASGL